MTGFSTMEMEPLIGIEDLAEYLDLPVKTLYKWRQQGTGPASVRVGRHVRYFVTDVQTWLQHQRRPCDPTEH